MTPKKETLIENSNLKVGVDFSHHPPKVHLETSRGVAATMLNSKLQKKSKNKLAW